MTPARDDSAQSLRPFIDMLPTADARACLLAWRKARRGPGLPRLRDFAPFEIPPRLVPWTLLYHRRPDGELIYGLAGEEMIHLFRTNPKGRRILEYALPEERASRLAVLNQVIDGGLPVWFTGALLFEDKQHIPIGRLCLPVDTGDGPGILLIYVSLGPAPLPRLQPMTRTTFNERDVHWCTEAELDALR